MDKKLILIILLSILFIVGAYLHKGFNYFFYGVIASVVLLVVSLTISFFIKKDTKYYDGKSG